METAPRQHRSQGRVLPWPSRPTNTAAEVQPEGAATRFGGRRRPSLVSLLRIETTEGRPPLRHRKVKALLGMGRADIGFRSNAVNATSLLGHLSTASPRFTRPSACAIGFAGAAVTDTATSSDAAIRSTSSSTGSGSVVTALATAAR